MNRHEGLQRTLRWYPSDWRQRYGDELAALCEDILDGEDPSWRFRVSLAKAGLMERARALALIGVDSSAHDRQRAGLMIVLCAWNLFVVSGAVFAKLSEHGERSVTDWRRWAVADSRTVIASLAVAAGLAAAISLVALARPIRKTARSGQFDGLRRPVNVALAASVAAIAGWSGLVVWAAHSSPAARDTADWGYGTAFIGAASLAAVAVAAWTFVAVAGLSQLSMSATELRLSRMMAIVVTGAMVAATLVVAAWAVALGPAHSMLASAGPGHPSPVDARFAVVGFVMVGADVIAIAGIARTRDQGRQALS